MYIIFQKLNQLFSCNRHHRGLAVWSVILGLALILTSIGLPAPVIAVSTIHPGICVYYYGGWSDSIQSRFMATLPEFIVANSNAGPYGPSRPNSSDIAALKAVGVKVLSYVPTGGIRGFVWNPTSPANDRTSVRQYIAAIAAEGDSGIYFDEGGLFSPVSGQTYQDSILDRTLASPGGISGNSRYNKAWGDSWAGYTVEDYLSYAHSLRLITCVGLDDYRASRLNANIFAVTDFVLTTEEYTTREAGMAPSGSETGHYNQCWVLAYDGSFSSSATNAALGYGFRAAYCCQDMSSLAQPAFENYVAAVTGGTAAIAPAIPPSAASRTTSPGMISNSNPGSSDSKSPGIGNSVPGAPAGAMSEVIRTTSTRATLRTNLRSLGSLSPVEVSFEYGLTTGYGSTAKLVDRSPFGDFLITIRNLVPNTTYHFRVKAVGEKTFFGEDQTFTTAAAKTRLFHKRFNGKN
jgi:hypothetical protein